MAVAVLRPLDAPPAEPVPVTALLLAPPPICAALRGRGGGLVLAVRPAGRVGAQAVLLSAVALEAGGRRGAELWLRGALLRRLGLAAGRRVAVWPVRRPPPLVWVLLGAAAAAGRAGRPAGGAVLARRGEALPGPGPGPGPLVLEARPALQGLLGNGTRVALAAPPPREAEAGPAPGGGAPCRRPAAPPLVSRFAAGRGRAEGPRLRAAPPCGGAGGGGAEVWVSRRGLLALGLFQGEWVRVSAEGAARPHLAALLARPPAWDYPRAARRRPPDGAALLAPALAFNLGCEPGGGTHVCLRVSPGERWGAGGEAAGAGRKDHGVPRPPAEVRWRARGCGREGQPLLAARAALRRGAARRDGVLACILRPSRVRPPALPALPDAPVSRGCALRRCPLTPSWGREPGVAILGGPFQLGTFSSATIELPMSSHGAPIALLPLVPAAFIPHAPSVLHYSQLQNTERSELVLSAVFVSVEARGMAWMHKENLPCLTGEALGFFVGFCRLVQEGDVLCVPTFGCAEFLDGNADKFLR